MPTGQNWFNFVYVNLGFALYLVAMYYFSSVEEIKENWPDYRCNPMYMPLSDNLQEDFTYCVQSMQTNLMGYLLQPITFITSSFSNLSGTFMTEINSVREMFNAIRVFITNIIQSIFGIFLNLIIEFQKITIGIKDLVGKLIGILATLMYVIDGSNKTIQSMWNGPPGQLVQALGKCFHPDTKIKLKNGNIVMMKDLNLGDILENGSRVNALMKIDNHDNEDLYILENKGVNGDNLYITGSHLVYDKSIGKYIEVKNYKNACKQEIVKTTWFTCLITDDHLISVGEELFWDWEDYIHKLKK
jgi:hypothetical protein